ncbi:zinc finger protein 511-like [Gracilinanus agilis]|uniref:zinc finger protein 511-like n=1 Tax=Gracilinanus agilis TaxID=191870 RepID=UPI001CFDBCA3|nr:zinc finger protein 511-like [Gracilinanus agilis]
MQLPPGLLARLGPGPPGGSSESSPSPVLQLPVSRHPIAGAAPFRFVPRAQSLPRGHPLFEDGDIQRHAYLQDVVQRVSQGPEPGRTLPAFGCSVAGCPQLFESLEAFEHHYRVLHTHVCASCRRSFPSERLLDAHVLEWHDALFQLLAERQSMYQCLVEGCALRFASSRQRREHLISTHRYPPDFRFDQPRKARRLGQGQPGKGLEGAPAQLQQQQQEQQEQQEAAEAMEVCPSAQEVPSAPKRTYSRRIPSTICFGQGAARGFKSKEKKRLPRSETPLSETSGE